MQVVSNQHLFPHHDDSLWAVRPFHKLSFPETYRQVTAFMWKPGSDKPRELAASTRGPATETTPSNPSTTSTSATTTLPLRTKKLSGATLNMRFMKRTEPTSTHHPTSETDVDRATSVAGRHQPQEGETTSDGRNDEVTSATPADMYGAQAMVLGRRSFGGLNKIIEEAWKSSYKWYKNETHDSKRTSVPDEELLMRYETFVKNGRRRDASDHMDTGSDEDRKKKRRKKR